MHAPRFRERRDIRLDEAILGPAKFAIQRNVALLAQQFGLFGFREK